MCSNCVRQIIFCQAWIFCSCDLLHCRVFFFLYMLENHPKALNIFSIIVALACTTSCCIVRKIDVLCNSSFFVPFFVRGTSSLRMKHSSDVRRVSEFNSCNVTCTFYITLQTIYPTVFRCAYIRVML